MMNNPYTQLVAGYARAFREGKGIQHGGLTRRERPVLKEHAPKALIFSPHPDDECIIGGLALRLLKESGFRISNVAVTQGSHHERQAARLEELHAACDFMGFDLITTAHNGLEGINLKRRQSDPESWQVDVQVIERILKTQEPDVIFVPHANDWNSTHIGVHYLVMDALKRLPSSFASWVVETEYWGAMKEPNLMVASSEEDVAEMVAGTSFHVGEVTRNPFHLLHPAWMQDNVRRGSELVGGQGESAPDFTFATLYRACRWKNGCQHPAWEGGRMMGLKAEPAMLFT
ncbi:MAG: PIG-L family deacetylase [Verrucomicrobiota bacterium]|nr:PIG-L family deacetylase [Verrucomicrobiota bacterium]